MFKRRAYYVLKPFLPWRLRLALRRIQVRHIRASATNIWPINETAGTRPLNWPGWPDGKKFALVLTHDVESRAGLKKTRQLAELEMGLGFRSSFNFVPEGPYEVPTSLRAWLREHDFEVGIHDYRHDGKLFDSHQRFLKSANQINQYLGDWGANGFRSGFMLRNLDWLHALNISYDSSTFDTDPFEMQSDGANTIFPFWVPAPTGVDSKRGGYAELPYTIPQDSTLFVVLEQTTAEIWIRKLDWVAAHGGMALLNVHPDYINFDGKPNHREYPHQYYSTFLEYLHKKYSGQFWHTSAQQLAGWFSSARMSSSSP